MKTLKLFLLAVVAVVMASCSGGNATIASKISKGEALTQDEYTEMIDYCGDYAKQAQTIQDQIDNLSAEDSESPQLAGLNSQLEELTKKFPELSVYSKAIKEATQEEVGEENVKKIDALAGLVWFDAPDWASTEGPADAAGLIETVAPADSTIIAAPALEDKIETK